MTETKNKEKTDLKSVMDGRLAVVKDTDTTLTPEEEEMWERMKKERDADEASSKRKFWILLIVYIILAIFVTVFISYVVYRMIHWDVLAKVIVLNSKMVGTVDYGIMDADILFRHF